LEQAISYRTSGKVAFKAFGLLLLLLFLAFNPIVLHQRFWDVSRVLRSVLVGTAELAIGIGLILLRRWAAVAVSLLAIYAAITIPSEYNAALRLVVLSPAILTVTFWGSLDQSFTRRDLVWIAVAIAISGVVEYVAFLLR
jgi:hypothetical protein